MTVVLPAPPRPDTSVGSGPSHSPKCQKRGGGSRVARSVQINAWRILSGLSGLSVTGPPFVAAGSAIDTSTYLAALMRPPERRRSHPRHARLASARSQDDQRAASA